MARQWRIEYPGALYHVMSRGNGGRDIYWSDEDRRLFLSLIEEFAERFDVEIHAYVLMSNHYHLLVKTIEANLSRAMQWFGTTYTRKFNIANHAEGHLFQGRFKSIIVQNANYLLKLSCYIHCNPLRAGMVARLADYPWSSYRIYAYKQNPPPWLTTQAILDELHAKDLHKAYRIKVQQHSKEQGSIWEDIKHGLVYGSQNFVDQIKAKYLGDDKDRELPQYNSFFRAFDPDFILDSACKALSFDLEAARSAPRVTQCEKDKRDLLIYLLWQTGRLSGTIVGEYFGLSYSAVSRRVKVMNDRIITDHEVSRQYERLKSQIKA